MPVSWHQDKRLTKNVRSQRLRDAKNDPYSAKSRKEMKDFIRNYLLGLNENEIKELSYYFLSRFGRRDTDTWVLSSRVIGLRTIDGTALKILENVQVFCRALETNANFFSKTGYQTSVRFLTVPVPDTPHHELIATEISRRYSGVPTHQIEDWNKQILAKFPKAKTGGECRRPTGENESPYLVCYNYPNLNLYLIHHDKIALGKSFSLRPQCPRLPISID